MLSSSLSFETALGRYIKSVDLISILLYRFVCCNASGIRPFRAGSSTFGKILKNHAGLLTSSTNCGKVCYNECHDETKYAPIHPVQRAAVWCKAAQASGRNTFPSSFLNAVCPQVGEDGCARYRAVGMIVPVEAAQAVNRGGTTGASRPLHFFRMSLLIFWNGTQDFTGLTLRWSRSIRRKSATAPLPGARRV